jgi:hypothetical protein
MISASVLPMSVGELPLQHYNTVLCLSRILNEADACLVFANDDIMPVAANRMARLVSCMLHHASYVLNKSRKLATNSVPNGAIEYSALIIYLMPQG